MNLSTLRAHIQGISLAEKVNFTRNLSLIIKAGMSLPQGLDILAKETTSALLGRVIDDIRGEVIQGKEFSEALKKHPSAFNQFYINMVKTGEVSGTLEKVLQNLANHLEKERALRSKVVGALLYPVIILGFMGLVLTVMMVFVIPRLITVFESFHVPLPLTTRILIATSRFLSNHSIIFFGSLAAIITAIWYFFTRTRQGKYLLDWILLHTPGFRNLTQKINAARIARTLQTLIKSGVSILEALSIVNDILENHYYKHMIQQARLEVEKGKPLHEILTSYPTLYPRLAGQLVAVGEETGSLELVLEELAEFYEGEVDTITKNLSSIMEPVVMIIIGSMVGLLAISVLQPIYSLTSGINP